MTQNARAQRLAVLIDADNTSPQIADALFTEIAKIGEASVRRIYGDFASANLRSWIDVLPRHAILPHQNFANTVGKNASDIALVIDAMDLLLSGRLDGFCLVSSDSDFTRLAARIREQGVDVYGFGKSTTPESFRQACRRFLFTENLLEGQNGTQDADAKPAPSLKPPSAATPLIRRALEQIDDEEGWASLSQLGATMGNLHADFDARTYGCGKLSDLVAKTGAFEIKRESTGHWRVRLKPKAKN